MNAPELIFIYSFRIVRREWRRFVLPLASLTITSVVLVLIMLLTASSTALLASQARELQGGDVVFESTVPIDGETLLKTAGVQAETVSEQLAFSGTLQSSDTTAPFTIDVIDDAYPLYGEFVLRDGIFSDLKEGEILIDEAGLKRLEAKVGDLVSFGEISLRIVDVIVAEPTSLFGGFRFLPTAFMSPESFTAAGVDPQLLRSEYRYAAKVPNLDADEIESLRALQEKNSQIDVDIAGQDQRGLQFGLATVSDFLVIAVLITAVLAAVNVYASILYLVTIERKSLAVLLALGLSKIKLLCMLGAALGYVVMLASFIGVILGIALFSALRSFIAEEYTISLPTPDMVFSGAVSSLLVLVIAAMSFVPAIRNSLELNPRQILIGGAETTASVSSSRSLALITLSILVPLVALGSFLLLSFMQGVLAIGFIVVVYVLIAVGYSFAIRKLYRARKKFSFFTRSFISQKFADGLFGVVSFASLFVALTALCTLALIQVSLERFLVNDLSESVPSTYVLDVQPSQKDALLNEFPDLELFSNVRARIIAIDEVRIQDELEAGNPDIPRELGREFNLTSRNNLLASETITAGTWSRGRRGEISVDENFAEQANITLGSTVGFSILRF